MLSIDFCRAIACILETFSLFIVEYFISGNVFLERVCALEINLLFLFFLLIFSITDEAFSCSASPALSTSSAPNYTIYTFIRFRICRIILNVLT